MKNKGGNIMVKHIILWKLKSTLTEEEKVGIKAGIKEGLESLQGKIPGLLEIKVVMGDTLASSNMDLMLDSTFEDESSLKNYSGHPDHVAVANTKVRPYTEVRSCLDFLC